LSERPGFSWYRRSTKKLQERVPGSRKSPNKGRNGWSTRIGMKSMYLIKATEGKKLKNHTNAQKFQWGGKGGPTRESKEHLGGTKMQHFLRQKGKGPAKLHLTSPTVLKVKETVRRRGKSDPALR